MIHVGIDVHQKSSQVCELSENGEILEEGTFRARAGLSRSYGYTVWGAIMKPISGLSAALRCYTSLLPGSVLLSLK